MQNKITFIVAAGGLLGALALAGCGGSGNSSLSPSPTPAVAGASIIGLWETTNVSNGNGTYSQQDRLARPLVNEVLATFANNRHRVNNEVTPKSDPLQLQHDIDSFLTFPAGRSTATKNVIESVLVPDIMRADLSQTTAAYLGVETKGATGGTFGGRKLEDDVVDISLGIVFGNTVSALGLAPDDHKEIPTLTKDNVSLTSQVSNTFPYLGEPH